jgi:hypothetical protein
MMRFRARPNPIRLVRRMLVWCLLVTLPIYGISATVTQWLGPLHFHMSPSSIDDELADWQDFRRVDHISDATIRSHTHSFMSGHSHSELARHHHFAGDPTLIALGADGHDDAPNDVATSAAMPLVFIAVAMPVPTHGAVPTASAPWLSMQLSRIRSADARRLERPPNA